MKKLFLCVATALCSTFAFADADLVVSDVTISAGGTETMEVSINKANTTAFQFDLKLPAGISVTNAVLSGTTPSTRKVEKVLYTTATNTWRFLTYDEGNAVLADGTKLNLTLSAGDGAESGNSETAGVVLVEPTGESTTPEGTTGTVTVSSDVTITLNQSGTAAFICDKDLDFSSLTDVNAYICSGYDVSTNIIYFCRVTDVPANTPIYVKGPANGTPKVPIGNSITYYGENYLIGDAQNPVDAPAATDDYLCWGLGKTQGWIGLPNGRTFAAGTAYLKLPKKVAKTAVSDGNVDITMSAKGGLAYVGNYDLDFSSVEGLTAYMIVGFDKNSTIWMTPITSATAGTPLYFKGSNNTTYSIPSSQGNMVWGTMLRGDADNSTALPVESGEYENWIYGKSSGKWGPLASDQSAFPAGLAYLPVLKSYAHPATSRGFKIVGATEKEVEIIAVKLGSATGEDDGTTGIRSIDEGQFTNDVWYNLNGQRIDTPTKKGLYIKNGKKVLVK